MVRIIFGVLALILAIVSIPPDNLIAQADSARRVNVPFSESAGWTAVADALVAAYAGVDVIVLGEAHGRKPDSDLRLALVRHPKFADTVRVIVTETEQPELAAALSVVNAGRPPDRRMQMRVNASRPGLDRNASAVAIVREAALYKNEKALVVFGSGHVWHGEGGVTRLLDELIPGRVLVVETIASIDGPMIGPSEAAAFTRSAGAIEATLRSRSWPVLIPLAGSAVAKLEADPFYYGQAMLGPDVALGGLADAVVYFGLDAGSPRAAAALAAAAPTPRTTIHGEIGGIHNRPGADHVYVAVRMTDGSGRDVWWTLQGDSAANLTKRGWDLSRGGGTLKLGMQVDVSGYVLAADQATLDDMRDTFPILRTAARDGRLLANSEVTLAGAGPLQFGVSR